MGLEYYTPRQHKKRYLSKKVQQQLRKRLDECRYLNALIAMTKGVIQQHHRGRDSRATCSQLLQQVNTTRDKYDTTHQSMMMPPPPFPFSPQHNDVESNNNPPIEAIVETLHTWLETLKDTHTTTRQAMWKLRTEEKQEMGRKYKKHWQQVLAKTPKKAYKHIFRKPVAAKSDGSTSEAGHK
jgi:hypothetical protein